MQLHLLGRSGDAAAPVRQEWGRSFTSEAGVGMQLHLLGRSGDAAAPVRQEWGCSYTC